MAAAFQPGHRQAARGRTECGRDRLIRQYSFRPWERFGKLLDGRQEDWYGLPALAELAPGPFIAQVWPWFLRVIEHIAENKEGVVCCYRSDSAMATGLRKGEEREEQMHPLVSAVESALRSLARQEPDVFFGIVERDRLRDALVVQRLLCRTLLAIVASHPAAALQFLTTDPRRLLLGPFDDNHSDSAALIAALVPHLTAEQIRTLEKAVMNWTYYRADWTEPEVEIRFQRTKYEREHRLRLLTAFPIDRLSPTAQSIVRAETVALPGYENAGTCRIWGGFVGSPMSDEQMVLAKDDDIVRLFTILEDNKESHPKGSLRGGSYQASEAFGRFAARCPERALTIIETFAPEKQEHPAAFAIEAISRNESLSGTVFTLILNLDSRGFRSEEFRVQCAVALGNCSRDGSGLPDPVCALLERWLGEPWKAQEEVITCGCEDEPAESRPASVLWQWEGMSHVPSGTYQLLRTLTHGYLQREPPAAARWLGMLQTHAERVERVAVWTALCRHLCHLQLCDHAAAGDFLQRLFTKYPQVRDSVPGATLVPHLWSFLLPAHWHEILQGVGDGNWAQGAQAFGELLGLRTLLHPEDQWAVEEVNRLLDPDTAPTSHWSARCVGLAFSAAELWKEHRCREGATSLLVRLIPLANDRVAYAIMCVFQKTDRLYGDEPSVRLLKTILQHPDVLRATEDAFLVEHLEGILMTEPRLVYDLCCELVRLRAAELMAHRSSFAVNASHLTNISLMLQRLGGDHRMRGLCLFETLLDIGAQEAHETLQELDKRPRNVAQTVRRRLLRRKRKPAPAGQ